jgi:hypothetical protein
VVYGSVLSMAKAEVVSHKLLGMPTIVTVPPRSLERSVPMEDVEAELRGAA